MAAARIGTVVGMGAGAAVRAARTALTGAENAGRVSSYERARGMGIDVRARWMATLDGRTRKSHRALDGEAAGEDGKFSNGLRYPGDPAGPASEVWNCRCTLVASVPGHDAFEERDASKLATSYEEWKAGRDPRRKVPSGRSLREFMATAGVVADIARLGVTAGEAEGAVRDVLAGMGRRGAGAFSGLTRGEQRGVWGRAKRALLGKFDFIDPKCPVYSALSRRQMVAMDVALGSADEDVARLYKRHEGEFVLADAHHDGAAYFSPDQSSFGVHLDIGRVEMGDSIHSPLETWFHEFGHHIDYSSGQGFGFATTLADGMVDGRTLGQTVKKEFDGIVADRLAVMAGDVRTRAEAAMRGRDLDGLRECGIIDQSSYEYFAGRLRLAGDEGAERVWRQIRDVVESHPILPKDGDAIDEVVREWKNAGNKRAVSNLSDMVHGATDGKRDVNGVGHYDDGYWTYGVTSLREPQSEEAFAEFTAAEVANAASLAVQKEKLPRSYAHYRRIVERMLR